MMKIRRPKMMTKKHRLKTKRMRRRPKITRRRRPRPPGATRMITLIKQLLMRRPQEMNERPRLPKQMMAQVRRQRATSAKNNTRTSQQVRRQRATSAKDIPRTSILTKLLLNRSPLCLSGRMAGGGVEDES
jgi:uncharacterized membrane protein YgaE (UPF0421/DUF939 family)